MSRESSKSQELSNGDSKESVDLMIVSGNLITMDDSIDSPYGLIDDSLMTIRDGKIHSIDNAANADKYQAKNTIELTGQHVSPGLIDCHTHVVFGANRSEEWEQRLSGATYEEIARKGGGILSTVNATRQTSAEDLFQAAKKRVQFSMQQGVTTLEIKSGYGLDLETETKMLEVATKLGDDLPVDISRTFLGAHTVPAEFKGQGDQYVDLVCEQMIPALKNHCEAVDVFCEGIGFDLEQTRRVFEAAVAHDLAIKIHAEQLSLLGGAKLASEFSAWSADHLEYLDEEGVQSMSKAGTVATLLPGAFYFINETQKPPVQLFRKYNVPVAVATDMNPGSSPLSSILLAMNLACTLFGLTAEEALAGVTRNAAAALRMPNIGTLEPGMKADFVVWDIASPCELAYGIGHNPCQQVFKNGLAIVDHKLTEPVLT